MEIDENIDRIIKGKDFKRIYQMLEFLRENEAIERKKRMVKSFDWGKSATEHYVIAILDLLENSEKNDN